MPDHVFFALQPTTVTIDGEQVQGWQLIKGGTTYEYRLNAGRIIGSQGAWKMVHFLLSDITPTGMAKLTAANWLKGADGFLAFDYRMLYEGAIRGTAIAGRSFTYTAVQVLLKTCTATF